MDRRDFIRSSAAIALTPISPSLPSVEAVEPLRITIEYYWFMRTLNGKWLWTIRHKRNDGNFIIDSGEADEAVIELPNIRVWLDGDYQHHVATGCDKMLCGTLEL